MSATLKYVMLAVVGGVATVDGLRGASPYIQAPPAEKTGRVMVMVDRQRNADGSSNSSAYKAVMDRVIAETGVKNVNRLDSWGIFGINARDTTQLTKVLAHPLVLLAEDSYVVRPSKVETVRGASKELWGIDRVDTRERIYDGKASFTGDGADVDVYVIDTGINVGHQELKGRAFHFWTGFPKSKTDPNKGSAAIMEPQFNGGWLYASSNATEAFFDDDNGHGSHCAGSVAGTNTGLAPNAHVYNAKVFLNGASTDSEIIWTAMHRVRTDRVNKNKRTVVSMSLGGTKSSNAYNEIITDLNREGIVVVVAAGNDNVDACTKAPAFSTPAITVGATDVNDFVASFSNWGNCVDIFAPGVNIYSAWWNAPDSYNAISGTSMACPHVSGAAAILLGQYPSLTPAEVEKVIVGVATQNAVKNAPVCPQSPNKLLYSRFDASRIYFSKSGSGKTDRWCQDNINDIKTRESCEIKPRTGCQPTAAGAKSGISDVWCKQVACAPAYAEFCSLA